MKGHAGKISQCSAEAGNDGCAAGPVGTLVFQRHCLIPG